MQMVKAVSVTEELAKMKPLRNRTAQTSPEEEDGVFARLGVLGDAEMFAGSFDGESPWERHPNGDELVQVFAGETKLTILSDDGEDVLHLSAGMLTVVPQGRWHRFHAPDGVSLMTATPLPTEHSDADDPRL